MLLVKLLLFCILFVATGGVWFHTWGQRYKVLVMLAGVVTLVGVYDSFRDISDDRRRDELIDKMIETLKGLEGKRVSGTIPTEVDPKDDNAVMNEVQLKANEDAIRRPEQELSPKSEVCTFSADTNDGITYGTVYFAGDGDKNGDKIKVDRETSLNNIKKPDHILINPQKSYFWSNNKGIKFHHNELPPKEIFEDLPGLTRIRHEPVTDNWSWQSYSKTTKWSINPLTKFECQEWTPDNSVFLPPININFLDASEEDGIGENNMITYVKNVWGSPLLVVINK